MPEGFSDQFDPDAQGIVFQNPEGIVLGIWPVSRGGASGLTAAELTEPELPGWTARAAGLLLSSGGTDSAFSPGRAGAGSYASRTTAELSRGDAGGSRHQRYVLRR